MKVKRVLSLLLNVNTLIIDLRSAGKSFQRTGPQFLKAHFAVWLGVVKRSAPDDMRGLTGLNRRKLKIIQCWTESQLSYFKRCSSFHVRLRTLVVAQSNDPLDNLVNRVLMINLLDMNAQSNLSESVWYKNVLMFYFIYLFNFSVVESSSGDLIDIIIVIISFLYTLLCKGFRQMWKLL